MITYIRTVGGYIYKKGRRKISPCDIVGESHDPTDLFDVIVAVDGKGEIKHPVILNRKFEPTKEMLQRFDFYGAVWQQKENGPKLFSFMRNVAGNWLIIPRH